LHLTIVYREMAENFGCNPNISRVWLPDVHMPPTWVCATNKHKVKTIFAISVIQMIWTSIIILLSFFGEEQLTKIIGHTVRNPKQAKSKQDEQVVSTFVIPKRNTVRITEKLTRIFRQ